MGLRFVHRPLLEQLLKTPPLQSYMEGVRGRGFTVTLTDPTLLALTLAKHLITQVLLPSSS